MTHEKETVSRLTETETITEHHVTSEQLSLQHGSIKKIESHLGHIENYSANSMLHNIEDNIINGSSKLNNSQSHINSTSMATSFEDNNSNNNHDNDHENNDSDDDDDDIGNDGIDDIDEDHDDKGNSAMQGSSSYKNKTV